MLKLFTVSTLSAGYYYFNVYLFVTYFNIIYLYLPLQCLYMAIVVYGPSVAMQGGVLLMVILPFTIYQSS